MDLFWKTQDWEKQDRHLRALKSAPFQRSLPKLSLSPGVTLIRGPRQIGKSTWMKLLLREAILKADASRVFYYSCEDLRDYRDLLELIASQKTAEYFFLDEITFIDEWWRAIKKTADSRDTLKLILTGSNSYDLRKGLDLMPGRWSKSVGEVYLLPMLFDEWLHVRKAAGWKDLDRVDALRLFMKTGGFPAAVAEAGENCTEPVQSKETYLRWIRGDVIKLGRQELFMKELMGQLVKIMQSSVSLQGLAQRTQLMSYHTVQDYLSILEQSFALRILYAYDPDTDTFRFKKDKKFYFTDPMVYWVACEWAGIRVEDSEPALAEMIASEWLHRRYKRLGYYVTRKGEVDFISNRDLAIEIKWAPIVNNLSPAYKELRLANKRVWSQGNFFEEPT